MPSASYKLALTPDIRFPCTSWMVSSSYASLPTSAFVAGGRGGGCIIVAKVAKFRQAYTIVGIHLWVVVIVANQFHFKLFDSDFGKLELFAFLCALYRGRSNPLQSSHAIAENLYVCMLYDNNRKIYRTNEKGRGSMKS